MKILLKTLLPLLILVSCSKPPTGLENLNYSFGGGAFILNEGNFRAGNGSLSFYSYDSSKIYNDLFTAVNGRSLGDVPNSMAIKGDKAYIVVNNSGKIEVIDQMTLASKGTIRGLNSPRIISILNDSKAYVSSLYSDSVAIISLIDNSISGYINLRRTSESIIFSNNKAYIANWAGGNEVMVINTLTDKVIDSVKVGQEPESMVRDKYGMVWVLCNGGWARQNNAELIGINTITDKVQYDYVFASKEDSPTSLAIDGAGQVMYFLDNGVRQMDISSTSLPASSFINPKSGEYFYKLGVNPINNDIIVSDAADFVNKGSISVFSSKGGLVTKLEAGIIPGFICFNLRIITTHQ
jgi:YVTN family beta-propeller protein